MPPALFVVVASRPFEPEAISLARKYEETLGDMMVVRARNGVYAVVASYLIPERAKKNVEVLKQIGLIPRDAFLSSGQDLSTVVWSSSGDRFTFELVRSPRLQDTVRRLQNALAKLQIYTGEIDGLVGDETARAFEVYDDRYTLPQGDAIDGQTVALIEQTASDGFVSQEERDEARKGGFSDSRIWREAKGAGFERYLDFMSARSAGFRASSEYFAFRQSGFATKAEFEAARAAGYSSRASYDAFVSQKLVETRAATEVLLLDAAEFLRLNANIPEISRLASLAGNLRALLKGSDLNGIEASFAELTRSLVNLRGFVEFRKEREDARARDLRNQIADWTATLSERQRAIEKWLARNLTHDASPALANLLEGIKADLAEASPGRLKDRLAEVDAQLAELELSGALFGDSRPVEDAQAVITPTDATRFMLDGSAEDWIAVYDAEKAPNLARNIRGEFDFENGEAVLCTYPAEATGALTRAVKDVLGGLGANRTTFLKPACGKAGLSEVDILLLRRREFLQATSIAPDILPLVEDARLRRFPPLDGALLNDRIESENTFKTTIEREIETGTRRGFGALALVEVDARLCAVIPPDQRAAHQSFIDSVKHHLDTEGREVGGVSYQSADDTFKMLQRRECGSAYAAGEDLSVIASALENDRRRFEILPLWKEEDRIQSEKERLEREAAELTRQREEERIKREEEQRIRKLQDEQKRSALAARRDEIRREYGSEAKAALVLFEEGVKAVVTGQRSVIQGGKEHYFAVAARDFFPQFSKWLAGLDTLTWKPTGKVDVSLVEYGIGTWRDRRLEALAFSAEITIVSAERGAYDTKCTLFAIMVDQEFDRLRDGIELNCNDTKGLADWASLHKLKSRWNP